MRSELHAAPPHCGAGHVGLPRSRGRHRLPDRARRRAHRGASRGVVRQADQLVEVGRHEQDRQTAGPGLAELFPHRRLRPDVDAARRVGGDQQATGRSIISRPTMNFCWLPPDRAWAAVSTPGVRTSKCSTICGSLFPSRPPVDPQALSRRVPRSGGRAWRSPTAVHRAAGRGGGGRRGCSRSPASRRSRTEAFVTSRPSSDTMPADDRPHSRGAPRSSSA